MATFTIFDAANSIGYTDILATLGEEDATPISFNSSQILAQVDQFTVSVLGNFIFSGPQLTGGVLQSVQMTASGVSVASIFGLNLDLQLLLDGTPRQINTAINGGADTITSAWNQGDVYETFGGDDTLQLGNGDDIVDGGAGVDRFILLSSFSDTDVSLAGSQIALRGPQGFDRLTNIEILQFSDVTLSVRSGSIGNDTLFGDGNTLLPEDLLLGGDGNDTASGGMADDLLDGGRGDDRLSGDAGNDRLSAGSGNDTASGGSGSDRILGGAGRDRLSGDAGRDVLAGQKGGDILIGGRGNDRLTGGDGRDVFQFRKGHGQDRITDFDIGSDIVKIGLGAARFGDLTFDKQGSDVMVSFANVDILIENVALSAIRDAANFDL